MATDNPTELITQKEWARRQGFTPQNVTNLIRRGIVIPVGKLRMINPEQADPALETFRNPEKPRQRKYATPEQMEMVGDSADTARIHQKARTKIAIIQGRLLELDEKIKTGELVDIKEVEKDQFAAARKIRDRMMNIPDRIAGQLAAETNQTVTREVLFEEIRIALKSLTDE